MQKYVIEIEALPTFKETMARIEEELDSRNEKKTFGTKFALFSFKGAARRGRKKVLKYEFQDYA